MSFDVAAFVLEQYGLHATVKPLDGYEDLNYLLIADEGQRFVLKCTTAIDALDFIESQNRVLNHLAAQGMQGLIPELIPTATGAQTIHWQNEDQSFYIRLFTFVEGTFLSDLPVNNEQLLDFGRFLGRMDQLSKDLKEGAIIARIHEWDHQHFLMNKEHLNVIEDVEQRRVIHYFLQQFEDRILPYRYRLRKGLIHNDPNDRNVLTDGQKITGIIDFGDMSYTWLICELAITIAYTAQLTEDPLECAWHLIKGYHEELPLDEQELHLLFYLIPTRLCTTLIGAAKAKKLNPDNAYISIHEQSAWKLLKQWVTINPTQAENVFRDGAGLPPVQPADLDEMLNDRFEHLSKAMSISYGTPIHMNNAAFQYMFDDRGNAYLDCVNNIMHVGHCHPKVVSAGQAQMTRLNTNTRYLYHQLNEYAARLAATFPDPLTKVYFVNSGSAAGDLAIRLARAHTGNKDVMVVDHGYHGNTSTTIDLSPYKYEGRGGEGKASYIWKAPIPDTYRGAFKADDPKAGQKYGTQAATLAQQAHDEGSPLAAFICESIIGCGGQVTLPEGYLKTVYDAVRTMGGVTIADEVQTGFARVGTHFWGFEAQEVVPDIVIMGKPIGNGHPMAAVITTEEIAASFENGMEFFSSFGGNPVSCAIGLAVLDVIEEESLQQHALDVGNYLIERLKKLQHNYAVIGDVRGSGLFLGIELIENKHTMDPATELAKSVINKMKAAGIMLSTDGPFNNVLKFKPPMCFSLEDADRLIHVFEQSL